MNSARITHISHYLPESVLENSELVGCFSGWTEEKIVRKLGIKERPIAAKGETSVDMAEKAMQRLFDSGIIKPSEIDFLMLCTQSPDYLLPTSACLLQSRLGLPQSCGALDFNLGCSGYVYGLALVKGLIECGMAKNVLLVTSETYSKYINEKDRGSRPLFGDGAAATLVQAEKTEEPTIGPFVFGTDGGKADMLIVPAGGQRLPASAETALEQADSQGSIRSQNQLYMNGPGIFTFALNTIPPLVEKLLHISDKTDADIGYYIFHQANRFMLDRLRERCNILDESRFFNNILRSGNTVSSSIPIAMIDAKNSGVLPYNKPIMLVGFGVGLSWAATLVKLSDSFSCC